MYLDNQQIEPLWQTFPLLFSLAKLELLFCHQYILQGYLVLSLKQNLNYSQVFRYPTSTLLCNTQTSYYMSENFVHYIVAIAVKLFQLHQQF